MNLSGTVKEKLFSLHDLGTKTVPQRFAYLLSIALPVITVWGCLAAGLTTGDQTTANLLLVSVLLSAYLGGLWAGLISAILGAVLADYFLTASAHRVQWIAYLIPGLLVSFIIGALRRSLRESEKVIHEQSALPKDSPFPPIPSPAVFEEHYATIINNIQDAIILHDLAGKVLDVNQPMLDLFGVTREEVVKMTIIQDLSGPGNPTDQTSAVWDRVVRGEKISFEWNARRPKVDAFFPVEVRLKRITLGKQDLILSSVRDISERKQTEETLRTSEERFRGIADNFPGVVFQFYARTNGDMGFYYVSELSIPLLGLDNKDIATVFKQFTDNIAPEDREKFLSSVSHAVQSVSKWDFEGQYIKPGGNKIYFRGISQPRRMGKEIVFDGVLLDITERKEAEKKLKQLADLQQIILATITPGLTYVKNRRVQWSNEAFRKMFGYDVDEGEIETAKLYAYAEDYNKVGIEGYAQLAHGGIYAHELQMKRKDGSIFWCHVVGKAMPSESFWGASIWMLQDITQRKEAEDALITNRALLRDSQRVAHIGCWDLVINEKKLFWNEEAYEIYGFHYGEIQPTFDDFMALVHPDDRGILLPHLQECIKTGQFRDFECRIVRKDGTERIVYVAGKVAFDDSGKPYRTFGIVQDITERKKAEEDKTLLEAQLVQAQKMESVGRLAGGVAHDFNNMLSVILGSVELIKAELTGSHPLMHHVLEIEKAAMRSADITRQLLAFSRKQVVTLKPIDLNALITATLKTLRRLIGEDIELRFQPSSELWKIKFDPSQIDQILINLAVNARDAMPAGGTLDVITENVYVDDTDCMEHIEYVPGDYVMLAVSDNGTGMPRETLSHIFEPFFTTKEVGKGTGLGLATIYGMVKQNGGFINVYSELGQGSTFKIYIPRNMEDEVPDEKVEAAPMLPATGTVLLVEDDEMVREITRHILKASGYTVLVANNPHEALSFCGKKEMHIDLMITDVIMPGMSGKDLRDRIEAIRPGIKVLFMSGYTADIIAHSGVLEQGVNFIQKPFSRNDLARKVNEIIRAG